MAVTCSRVNAAATVDQARQVAIAMREVPKVNVSSGTEAPLKADTLVEIPLTNTRQSRDCLPLGEFEDGRKP